METTPSARADKKEKLITIRFSKSEIEQVREWFFENSAYPDREVSDNKCITAFIRTALKEFS